MQWGRDPQNPVSNVSDEPMMINDAILDGWSSMGRNLQVQPFHPCLYQRRQDWCEGPSGTTFTGGWLGDSRSTWPCQTPEFIQMRSIVAVPTWRIFFPVAENYLLFQQTCRCRMPQLPSTALNPRRWSSGIQIPWRCQRSKLAQGGGGDLLGVFFLDIS